MSYDYGFDDKGMTDLYDAYYHDELPDNQSPVEEPEFITSQESFMDWDMDAGIPMWLDPDDLEFLFRVRYSSPAFTQTFLQENYRLRTHATFSSLLRELITKKLEAMNAMPSLYENQGKNGKPDNKNVNGFIDKDNVIEIAYELGIDPTRIDVATVVSDVASNLEDIFIQLVKWHPHMNAAEKKAAVDFLDGQLWCDEDKQVWRAVTAEVLAKLFDYRMIPRGMVIIQALDSYVHDEFSNGYYQSYDLENADLESVLNDNVVNNVLDALALNDKAPVAERLNDDWVIQDAIAAGQQEYDWWAEGM